MIGCLLFLLIEISEFNFWAFECWCDDVFVITVVVVIMSGWLDTACAGHECACVGECLVVIVVGCV